MKWAQMMLTLLLAERQAGERDFATAWRRASNLARAKGVKRPRDFTQRQSDDPGWMPYSTFVRHAYEAEWNGLVAADYLHLRDLLADSGPTNGMDAHASLHGRTRLIA